MGKPMISGNWKMNMDKNSIDEFLDKMIENNKDNSDEEILFYVPSIYIPLVSDKLKASNIKYGAENFYHKEKGAFTGEVSPLMLKDYDVEYVLIGHSERRHVFNESDELLNEKVKSAIKHDLKPTLCVGELLTDRESGNENSVVEEQVRKGLKDLTKDDLKDLVIAYEPVWAIGTGKTAEPKDAHRMHVNIRNVLKDMYDEDFANKVRIVYGGSVKPANIDSLMIVSQIDGVLVGGASLDNEKFQRIINYKKTGC